MKKYKIQNSSESINGYESVEDNQSLPSLNFNNVGFGEFKDHMKNVFFGVQYISMVSQNRQNGFPVKVRKEMEERFVSYVKHYNTLNGTSIDLDKRTMEDVDKNGDNWKKMLNHLAKEYKTLITPILIS